MPTVPACRRRGASTAVARSARLGHPPRSRSSGAPAPGTSPTLIGFSSQPANPAASSQSSLPSSGSALSATTGIDAVRARPREPPRRLRRPCPGAGGPSGSRPAGARPRARSPRRRVAASSVRNPAAPQHVPGELPVLLVVVDDQDERRSSGHRASGVGSPYPRPCRSGSCSPRITTSSARASGGCSRRSPTSRSRPCAATSTRCSPRSDAERPDVVVTDIRMPPGNTDEGIQAADAAARDESRGRRRRAQPVREPELRARAPGGRQRAARLPPEGARQGSRQLVAAIRAVADGGSVIDPKVVEALVAENARGEGRRSTS